MLLRWVVSNLLSQLAEDKMREVAQYAKVVVDPVLRRSSSVAEKSDGHLGLAPDTASDIVVLFALGLESGGFVDRMTDVTTMQCATFTERAGTFEGKRLVVCESGVGGDAARRATEDIIKVFRPRWIVSAGFAAAMQPKLQRGHIVMANSLRDQQGCELEVGFRMDPRVLEANPSLHVGRLLTVDNLVRHRREKEQLAADFDAIACDMETFPVATVCQARRVRFLSVRVISDQLDDRLPDEVEHMLNQESVAGKVGAVTRALFQRPGSVKDMWKLQETAIRAADRLAKFLAGVLPQLEVQGGERE